MALPSSGQISFDNVRVEMSQSVMPSYTFSDWVAGCSATSSEGYSGYCTPINVNSPAKPFSSSSKLTDYRNVSMSLWYGYSADRAISSSVTTSLFQHMPIYSEDPVYTHCFPSSMTIIDLGTTNTTYSINVSGSLTGSWFQGASLYIWYGRPWSNNGRLPTGSATLITSSIGITDTGSRFNFSHTYNYTYNAALGSNIYVVVYGWNCCIAC